MLPFIWYCFLLLNIILMQFSWSLLWASKPPVPILIIKNLLIFPFPFYNVCFMLNLFVNVILHHLHEINTLKKHTQLYMSHHSVSGTNQPTYCHKILHTDSINIFLNSVVGNEDKGLIVKYLKWLILSSKRYQWR